MECVRSRDGPACTNKTGPPSQGMTARGPGNFDIQGGLCGDSVAACIKPLPKTAGHQRTSSSCPKTRIEILHRKSVLPAPVVACQRLHGDSMAKCSTMRESKEFARSSCAAMAWTAVPAADSHHARPRRPPRRPDCAGPRRLPCCAWHPDPRANGVWLAGGAARGVTQPRPVRSEGFLPAGRGSTLPCLQDSMPPVCSRVPGLRMVKAAVARVRWL